MGSEDYVFPDGRILSKDGKIIEPEGWIREIDPKVMEFINSVPKDPPPARSLDEADIYRPQGRMYRFPQSSTNAAVKVRSPHRRVQIAPGHLIPFDRPEQDQPSLPRPHGRTKDQYSPISSIKPAASQPHSSFRLVHPGVIPMSPNPNSNSFLVSTPQPSYSISNRERGQPQMPSVQNRTNVPSQIPSNTTSALRSEQLEIVPAIPTTHTETVGNQAIFNPNLVVYRTNEFTDQYGRPINRFGQLLNQFGQVMMDNMHIRENNNQVFENTKDFRGDHSYNDYEAGIEKWAEKAIEVEYKAEEIKITTIPCDFNGKHGAQCSCDLMFPNEDEYY
jgi:hypothetical protein